MRGCFAIVRMIPLLSLILCLVPPQVSAFPARGCLPELLIPSDNVILNQGTRNEMLLVDIRPPAAFERLRIPGSLNFPLYVIKAKTFLKKYDLVVVDEGYRYARIEEECRRLKRQGFRLRILNGGLSTWNRKGGVLEGDDLARKSLSQLSPLNFFQEKDGGNWLVVNVSEGERPESVSFFPRGVSIPYVKDRDRFVARYEELLKKEIGGPCDRILVADERGEHYGSLEGIIRTTAFPDVFFLEGGVEGYQRFVEGINSAGKRLSTTTRKNCCGGSP